jgi:hypothetical protein
MSAFPRPAERDLYRNVIHYEIVKLPDKLRARSLSADLTGETRHLAVLGLSVESHIPAGSGTRLWGDGFEVDTLINIRIAQAGLIVAEVPSYEHERIHGISNLKALSGGWRVLRTIIAERYYRHRRVVAGHEAYARSAVRRRRATVR